MNRLLIIPLACLILAITNGSTLAIHKCGNRCVKCPRCQQGCCKLDVREGKEKKHYWTIETEQVCIPKIVWPWRNGCLKPRGSCDCGKRGCGGCANGGCTSAFGSGGCGKAGCSGGCGSGNCRRPNHNGARVRTVRKPKKHSYECPVCEYKWSAEGGCSGCSDHTSSIDDQKNSSSDDGKSSEKKSSNESPEPPVEDESGGKAGAETKTPTQVAPADPELGVEPAIEEAPPKTAPRKTAAPKDTTVPAPTAESWYSTQRHVFGRLAPSVPDYPVVDPFRKQSVFDNR